MQLKLEFINSPSIANTIDSLLNNVSLCTKKYFPSKVTFRLANGIAASDVSTIGVSANHTEDCQ